MGKEVKKRRDEEAGVHLFEKLGRGHGTPITHLELTKGGGRDRKHTQSELNNAMTNV